MNHKISIYVKSQDSTVFSHSFINGNDYSKICPTFLSYFLFLCFALIFMYLTNKRRKVEMLIIAIFLLTSLKEISQAAELVKMDFKHSLITQTTVENHLAQCEQKSKFISLCSTRMLKRPPAAFLLAISKTFLFMGNMSSNFT